MVSDKEQYLFDLNGYIVVKGALSKETVDHINGMIDVGGYDTPENMTRQGHYETHLERDEVMRSLIDNPKIMPYLEAWVTPKWEGDAIHHAKEREAAQVRLDHSYFIFTEPNTTKVANLHLGATPHVPSFGYEVRDRHIYCGMSVVGYVLNEVPWGQGGFACLPGSHKSNFPCPRDFKTMEDMSATVSPKVEIGDAVIFTESLTHGTLAWMAPYKRRALFYKYCPSHIAWSRPRWSQTLLDKCTPNQRSLLEPAFCVADPEFFAVDEEVPERETAMS